LTRRQKRLIFGLLILAVVALRRCDFDRLGGKPSADLPETCRVARLSDGDSLTCSGGERLRLIGIDAPEQDQPPFGQQAQAGLERILAGRELSLEYDLEGRDQFDRLLAYAWIDSELVNEEMVRQGWAVAFHVGPNTRYSSRLRRAEKAAKADRIGLWASGGFECRPVDHRNNRC
jgi:micrococcal nuclease